MSISRRDAGRRSRSRWCSVTRSSGEAEDVGPVLVYASWGCGECELCLAGEEQLCPRATEAGWVEDGGYAEFVRVPSRRYLFPLAGIDPVRAAPLADAGITSYRAVRRFSALLGMARAPSSSAAAGWANSRSNTCAC